MSAEVAVRSALLVMAILGIPSFAVWSQENGGAAGRLSVEELQSQLKASNARVVELEERVRLMTVQQQGAVQFFQAGQALCELDKKQSPPSKTEK